VLIGAAPLASSRAPSVPSAFTEPLALRELQAVHASLASSWGRVGELATFDFLVNAKMHAQFEATNGAPADRFVKVAELADGDAVVFDRDWLDGRGDPVVRAWTREGWELSPRAMSFWGWFGLEDHVLPPAR
jgi:hypothetical protein